jgi:hypothetical protein
MNKDEKNESIRNDVQPYEAPAIEQVVTPETIEREVHYAGIQGPSDLTN